MENAEQVLGSRAFWGKVGYAGDATAPTPGTYAGVDALGLRYTTVSDSGQYPGLEAKQLANLTPLVMMALYDVGFAWEAGPLTSWSN